MNEHESVRFCCGERDDRRGAVQKPPSWHRSLLVCTAVILAVCGSLPGEAVNGELVAAEGVFRAETANCTEDPNFTISCDDEPQSGVVSCHMRGPSGDEGLALNACIDGQVTTGKAEGEFLETDTTISATDFGKYFCGTGSDGFDFCVVCDTFKDPEASIGASHCVKIVNDGHSTPGPSSCGAYNISSDPGGACESTRLDLQQSFSAPRVGFTIAFDASDAGVEEAKDLLVCGGRSWQCIEDRSLPLASGAEQIQQQQLHGLINTPCCIRLSTGGSLCNSTWKVSATCR